MTLTLTSTLKNFPHSCHLLMNPQNLPEMVKEDSKQNQNWNRNRNQNQTRHGQKILCPTTISSTFVAEIAKKTQRSA